MQSETQTMSPKKPARHQAPRHPFDRRRREARRFADLVEQFSRALQGAPSAADRLLIEQAATLSIRAEQLQTEVVRGQPVPAAELVALSRQIAEILVRLGIVGKVAA